MSSVSISSSGSTDNLERFLKEMKANSMFDALDSIAQRGVDALASATPQRTGLSAGSWSYKITTTASGCEISWYNHDVDETGVPIVLLIQYGHGTGTGGYVAAYDFINPVTQEIFDDIENAVWKAVQSA